MIPTKIGRSVLIDAGANADARPEHLLQFAHMGAVFAEEILEVPDPEVRLLSIGEEPEKGNQLTLEAHELLRGADHLRFGGNIEGRTLLEGDADVIVADGFTGNVALKTLEGTVKSLLDALRAELESSTRGKLGGALIRPAARGLRSRLDPETYGGRLPPRPERPRRDRARLELTRRDRERDPPRRPRRRAPRRRTPARADFPYDVLESARSTTPTVER